MPKYLPLLFITVLIFNACKQKPVEPVYVGLQVYKVYDSSRTFDTTATSKNVYRPVKIDVFFPSAQKPTAAGVTYGDMMDMYEQRFNFNTPLDTCKKTTLMFAKAFCQYFHVNSVNKFLGFPLTIYRSLQLPAEKHPLIIYAAGMNGSSWDNPVLFDSLASNGYVVAAVSSVGKYPGYMSDPVDMDEQVRDILFTINQMKAMPYVDSTSIGIVSWSMGGTAALKAAMLTKDIKAIASYDGTDIHAYGPDKDWDKQFKQIMAIPPTNVQSVDVPYMYLRSEHPDKIDSMYNALQLISSKEKYFMKFTDGLHEDFSSRPTVIKYAEPTLKNVHTEYVAAITRLTLLFFDQYVKKDKDKNTGSYIDALVQKDSTLYKKDWPKY